MSNSPYEGFFNKDPEKPETPENQVAASEEMQAADRGQPTVKVEKDTKIAKNTILAGIAVIFTLVVVAGIIATLMKRVSGGDEDLAPPVENTTLAKQEEESLANMKARMAADKRRKEEADRLERERLAALAREKAERDARKAEEERLEQEKNNPPPPPPGTPPSGPSLGNMSNSGADAKPLSQRKPDELTEAELAQLRKGRGDVLGYVPQATQGKESGQSKLERPNALGNMLITERHADGYATLRKSRKFLLMHGTNIPCTIMPRVITNYFSQPTCIVNEDVYSPEGVVLIDRGSKVIGEQRTTLKRGSARVFIAWADIETDEGVSVKIDSMAADALGGAGVDAWIDNHWVERFGSAILLSFVDDLFKTIAAQNSGGNNNQQVWDSSTDNANSMAEMALENSINIEPTGYIMPAQQVNIIVARDIDFTNIYKVK